MTEYEHELVEGGEAPASPPPGDLEHYSGQWVAVRGGEVVASAADEESLRALPEVQDGDDVYPIGDPPSGFYFVEGSV